MENRAVMRRSGVVELVVRGTTLDIVRTTMEQRLVRVSTCLPGLLTLCSSLFVEVGL